MAISIKAHFDGRTIVPDEPLNLPADQPLEVEILLLSQESPTAPVAPLGREALRRLVARAVSGRNIPRQALRRESLYEERW